MPSPEHISTDQLNEECGIIGTFLPNHEAAPDTLIGLLSVQHRGQEAAGMATGDGQKIYIHRGNGLVPDVFHRDFKLDRLPGHIAIGHTRYATSSVTVEPGSHLQPVTSRYKKFALAHNGNLPDPTVLYEYLDARNVPTDHLNDSELMHADIDYQLKHGASVEEAVKESSQRFVGAWSLAMMTPDKLIAARDPNGIRHLSLGRMNGGYVVSSETCTFDLLDAQYIRDIQPGEMVTIDGNGPKSFELSKGQQKLDIFELVYFARPDSILFGQTVENTRVRMGQILAGEMEECCGIDADIVFGIPDSGTPGGFGFAKEAQEIARKKGNEFVIQHVEGFVRDRYAGRTFQRPGQDFREKSVDNKLNPLKANIYNKKLIYTDDSVVRGTTARRANRKLRNGGAREIHMGILCPPILFPDFHGIDTPDQNKLIAANHRSLKEMADNLGADSIHFLSLEGLFKAIGVDPNQFCTQSFTGEYPTEIGKREAEVTRFEPINMRH